MVNTSIKQTILDKVVNNCLNFEYFEDKINSIVDSVELFDTAISTYLVIRKLNIHTEIQYTKLADSLGLKDYHVNYCNSLAFKSIFKHYMKGHISDYTSNSNEKLDDFYLMGMVYGFSDSIIEQYIEEISNEVFDELVTEAFDNVDRDMLVQIQQYATFYKIQISDDLQKNFDDMLIYDNTVMLNDGSKLLFRCNCDVFNFIPNSKKEYTSGELYITTKGIVFTCDRISKSLNYKDIIDMKVDGTIIQVTRMDGPNPLFRFVEKTYKPQAVLCAWKKIVRKT